MLIIPGPYQQRTYGFQAPSSSTVVQFSDHCRSYNFTGQNGRSNIGRWIEAAATQAGR